MIRTHHVLMACACLVSAGAAIAQRSPESMIPPESQRPPVNQDISTNPSAYDQVNRAIQNEAADKAKQPLGSNGRTRAAAAAEIVIGSPVRDKKGKPVGSVEFVESDGAVVVTGAGKVKVPLEAFGKDQKGLVIGISKADFDKLVTAATGSPAA
jgi:hypothetical protein